MDIKNFEERRIDGEVKFSGRVVRLEVDRVTLPNGQVSTREVVRHPGAVCVVPINERGEVLCVRQYRYPHEKMILEIPAGKLEPGETDRAAAALRELSEETGASCGKLTFMGDFLSSPAILSEVIGMYLAEDLTLGDSHPDDDEFVELEAIPLDTLCEMAARGEITDGKTQAAVFKAAYILSKR